MYEVTASSRLACVAQRLETGGGKKTSLALKDSNRIHLLTVPSTVVSAVSGCIRQIKAGLVITRSDTLFLM